MCGYGVGGWPNVSIPNDCRGCPLLACAVQRRRFPVGASPTRRPRQPEAIGAVMEVTKWLKPSIGVSRIGDSASVQAATRVNAEQALYEEGKLESCRSQRMKQVWFPRVQCDVAFPAIAGLL